MPRAVVIHNVVKMHAQPDADSEQVSQTVLGRTLLLPSLSHREEKWVQVQTDDSYMGWVRATQVRLLDESEEYPSQGKAYRVNALWAFVREQPDTRSPHLTIAPMGALLEGREWHNDWLQVRLPDGQQGWVWAQDVTSQWVVVTRVGSLRVEGMVVSQGVNTESYVVPRAGWQNALVYTAKRLLGVPYLWGGSSPFGLDCSGFVQLVYRMCGLVIPRDADLQAEFSRSAEMPLEKVQPGDLIFFAGGNDPHRRTVTHVGMIVDGEHFIHSAGGIGVNVTRLDDPYYRSILWGVRRVVDA
ncbi:MAG: NlpC/P60 family protein [Armatimonadota bacterium]|nr:NlpC/P60 family protein [bacterium]MDW8320596.1 NlpC/P60 family protein [Armatimonadota bacterium]